MSGAAGPGMGPGRYPAAPIGAVGGGGGQPCGADPQPGGPGFGVLTAGGQGFGGVGLGGPNLGGSRFAGTGIPQPGAAGGVGSVGASSAVSSMRSLVIG